MRLRRSQRGVGGVAVLVMGALLAVVVPLGMALSGAVLSPRAWSRRARWREENGFRRVRAAGPDVTERRSRIGGGRELTVRSVPLGIGTYAVVTLGGAGGAMLMEGADSVRIGLAAARQWEAELEAERRMSAESGESRTEAAVQWLGACGLPEAAARKIL